MSALAKLVEVGTTNLTHIFDYEQAITENTVASKGSHVKFLDRVLHFVYRSEKTGAIGSLTWINLHG